MAGKTYTISSLRQRFDRLPPFVRDNYASFDDFVSQLEAQGNTVLRGTGEGGTSGAPPGSPEIIDAGDQTIISGLPLFNQSLRYLLSNIFTNFLASSAQQAGGSSNIFSSFLPQFIQSLGLGQGSAPGNTQPTNRTKEGARDTQTGTPTTPNEIQIGNPPPSKPENPPVVQTDSGQGSLQPILSMMQSLGGGALGNPAAPSGGEQVVGPSVGPAIAAPAPDPVEQLFTALLGGGSQKPTNPVAGLTAPSFGLGEIAAIASLGQSLFGGNEQPQQIAKPQTPYQPNFDSPNSLAAFMQLLQLFGPGSGSPFGGSPALGYDVTGASPNQGDLTTQQPFDIGSLFPGGADNPLTDIISQFSLPSYDGPFSAPSTPLQQQATDYASEFLKSSPLGNPGFGNDTLQELISTGGRFDLSPQFSALENITNRRLDEGNARINEAFGSQGLRFGSDVARGQAGLTAELLAQESAQRAQIAQQSFENATNRRLQALGLAPQYAAQSLGVANQAFNLGEQSRQAQDTDIQRRMAEFARTQGALFPLLLQFALAGTEGDTIVLD